MVENIKSALEVPPLSGADYENPGFTALRELDTIDAMTTLTGKNTYSGNINLSTGLPITVPGHDSVLLATSRHSQLGEEKYDNTGKIFTRSKSQLLNKTSSTMPDEVSLRNDMYSSPTLNSTFITLFGDLAIRYFMTQVRVEKYNISENLSAQNSSYAQINTDKVFL